MNQLSTRWPCKTICSLVFKNTGILLFPSYTDNENWSFTKYSKRLKKSLKKCLFKLH
jgi:hypothetical protein